MSQISSENRSTLAHLEQTMRGTPGFVAYYFAQTDDRLATVTITDDERRGTESMGRAADWVTQNLPNAALGAPEVT